MIGNSKFGEKSPFQGHILTGELEPALKNSRDVYILVDVNIDMSTCLDRGLRKKKHLIGQLVIMGT